MVKWGILLVSGLLLVGCGPGEDRGMIHLDPPAGWEASLNGYRESRDEYFRTSPETPLLPEVVEGFQGLDYFPTDENFYLVGGIRFYPEPEPLEMITTSGQARPCLKVGWIDFEVDGQPARLQVYRLTDSPTRPGDPSYYFLPFADGTTGEETYPSGRYVDLFGPQGGPWVLDFNRAYNPSCAYGAPERYACPVTPVENRLSVRIAAGERGYHHPTATDEDGS